MYDVINDPPSSGAYQTTVTVSLSAINEVTGWFGIAGIYAAKIETSFVKPKL